MSVSGVSDWDDELNKYRRGAASRRSSVAAHNVPAPITQQYRPTITNPIIDDEDDDISSGDEDTPYEITESSIRNGHDDNDTLPGDKEVKDDDDDDKPEEYQQPWVLLQGVGEANYHIYYNKNTKETTLIPPPGFIPPSHQITAQPVLYDDALAPIERVKVHIESLASTTDAVLRIASVVSPLVVEQLNSIKQTIHGLQDILDNIHEQQTTTMIDTLIGTDTLQWAFSPSATGAAVLPGDTDSSTDSSTTTIDPSNYIDTDTTNKHIKSKIYTPADYYRKASQYTDHGSLLWQDWSLPQYFGTSPILYTTTPIRVHVSIPVERTQSSQGAAAASGSSSSSSVRTTLEATPQDMVSTLLQRAISKLYSHKNGSAVDYNNYVFKVLGYEDYLTAQHLFFSYSYVRKCHRDMVDVELLIMEIPQPYDITTEDQENIQENIRLYYNKIHHSISVDSILDLSDVTSTLAITAQQKNVLLSNDLIAPSSSTALVSASVSDGSTNGNHTLLDDGSATSSTIPVQDIPYTLYHHSTSSIYDIPFTLPSCYASPSSQQASQFIDISSTLSSSTLYGGISSQDHTLSPSLIMTKRNNISPPVYIASSSLQHNTTSSIYPNHANSTISSMISSNNIPNQGSGADMARISGQSTSLSVSPSLMSSPSHVGQTPPTGASSSQQQPPALHNSTSLPAPSRQQSVDDNTSPVAIGKPAQSNQVHTAPGNISLDKPLYLPYSSVQVPFNLRLIGLNNIKISSFPRLTSDMTSIYIRSMLFHGCETLAWTHDTPPLPVSQSLNIQQIQPGTPQTAIGRLPRETRIGFIIYGSTHISPLHRHAAPLQSNTFPLHKKDIALGYVVANLFNEDGLLLSGPITHSIWALPDMEPGTKKKRRHFDTSYIYRCLPINNNTTGIDIPTLRIEYPIFNLPVYAPLVSQYTEPNLHIVGPALTSMLDKVQSSHLLKTMQADSLHELSPEMKQILWASRHYVIDVPSVLPKLLLCVDWGNPDYRSEAYRLLEQWEKPVNPVDLIELLDARYADYKVRSYAIKHLDSLNNEELQLFLLQLVQCLKYESYHFSPLARWLISRALQSPYQIGHSLFWHLKTEVHTPHVTERFALMLEELLTYCGPYIYELSKQVTAVQKLQGVAQRIVDAKRLHQQTDEDTIPLYHSLLHELNEDVFERMGSFQVPLNPRWRATTLIVEKCRYMSSKMVPLWLVFKNADESAPPICFIFKSGDDLRQDLLTLQLLRVMDNIWLNAGLDMRLKPYNVIATGVNKHGDGVGMIEVVLNSDTTSSIQVKWGGGAMGALRLNPLDLFIRDNNRDAATYKRAVDNFVRSCAGYCVATYVLGIGDRHNGNIMLTKSGHLFHIDFGHFLGNFKKKFGVNRERAAFVFTPEMAFVMGGEKYKKSQMFLDFKKMCTRCFRSLRQNASLLEILFLVMVAAGMPELLQETDIYYLRNKLLLDKDSKAAAKELQDELKKSLDSTYRRIDNMIHNVKHKG